MFRLESFHRQSLVIFATRLCRDDKSFKNDGYLSCGREWRRYPVERRHRYSHDQVYLMFCCFFLLLFCLLSHIVNCYRKSNLTYHVATKTDLSVLLDARTLLFVIPNNSRSLATMALVICTLLLL